jgi:hypothetical protein
MSPSPPEKESNQATPAMLFSLQKDSSTSKKYSKIGAPVIFILTLSNCYPIKLELTAI